jgi:CheY-like chemotaxis protein
MLGPSRLLDDPASIRMVFQRLCRQGGEVSLKLGFREWPFALLAETEGHISLAFAAALRTKWQLKKFSHVELSLRDRGNRYQATLELEGWEDVDGQECCQFAQPRELRATDYDGLSDYVPETPVLCTFSSPTQDICEGRLRAMGHDGVEFVLWGTGAVKEGQLKMGALTTLDVPLGKAGKAVLRSVTVSMNSVTAAVRFHEKADPDMLKAYRAWLQDVLFIQEKRDREGFDVRGAKAAKAQTTATLVRSIGGGVQVLSDKVPLVLVIGEGGFPARMAEALGRKFGIAGLDFVQSQVRPMLEGLGGMEADWGRVKLILVHQRLRLSSGLELTRQLTQEEGCPLPILVAGTEEDVTLKRNRAITCGAVDFIAVEPFRILAVMRAVEATLKLFG